jgi:hypothetical protein
MKKLFILTVFISVSSQESFATIYRSIANGRMDSPTTWFNSLVPTELKPGDLMFISHLVTLPFNFQIGGYLIVFPGGMRQDTSKSLDIQKTGRLEVNGGLVQVKNIVNDGIIDNRTWIEVNGKFN